MESSDSDDMEESDPESPSVPDNAAPMPWEVNPRRIKDLVETQPIVPLQYSEWRALKIRSFGDWETEPTERRPICGSRRTSTLFLVTWRRTATAGGRAGRQWALAAHPDPHLSPPPPA
eukprot:COSAG04_NODE_9203_length_887_cov_2.030457_1_plen_117_part_01